MLGIAVVLVLGSALAVPRLEADDNNDGRIIGGTDAPVGQYPYQISIKLNNRHHCGGSIISPNWILTAAHCVDRQSATNMQVIVGTNYLNSGGVPHGVSRVIMHERYNPMRTYVNDIAVLQLSTPIRYNNVVRPISLATSELQGGVSCILSGWGTISYPQNNYPNSLQHISLTSITLEQCRQGILPAREVYASSVCTREPSGRGGCHGDSGGPLVCRGVQHGVVSWGEPCAIGYPDVFSSVAYYRNWIKSRTGV